MHKKTIVFIAGGLVTIIFLLFTWDVVFKYSGVLTRVNYIFYDASLKVFHKREKSDKIVIVDIDEKSLKYDGRWPWPRNRIADIVKALQNSGAAVIVFDVLLPDIEPNIADVLLKHARVSKDIPVTIADYLSQQLPYFDNDKILADTLAKSDVVLGVFFNRDILTGKLGKPIITFTNPVNLVISQMPKFIGNIPILADSVQYTGFTTTNPDEDGSIRRSPLLIKYNGDLYPSLALEAVRAYLLIEKISLDLRDVGTSKVFLGVQLGDTYIPTDSSGELLINYIGPAFSFPYVSASDVIQNKFSPKIFEGKIVLIGSSSVGIGDLHSMPLQSIGYPGVEIHANIIESILNRNLISSPLWLVGVERILIIVLGLIFTILAAHFSMVGLLLLTLGMMGLIFVFNAALLLKWQWVLPHLMLPYLQILTLGVANSVYGYFFENRYRKKMHDIYGQYVSSEHIDKMLEFKDLHALEGNTKMMTVLFADVRSFTSISEKLDARQVKKFLNTLFTPLTKIIFEFKGTIDKYVGDMIVAFWSDPIDDPQHASNAVKTALLMQNKVKELAPFFAEQNLTNIGIRIGINTGIMHVGDMGSEYRKAYTVLGDSVNLASRLEGVNKKYGTDILVSQATKDQCNEIVFRFIDCIYVKGKVAPTKIYEPLCLLGKKTAALEVELEQYKKALELYDSNDWSKSKEEFAKLTAQYPNIEIYSIYLKRVSQYETSPPPQDWDRGQHLVEK